ncbi:MAG: hypothetical protein ACKVUS_17505 [Saprospiraceae bacterium]
MKSHKQISLPPQTPFAPRFQTQAKSPGTFLLLLLGLLLALAPMDGYAQKTASENLADKAAAAAKNAETAANDAKKEAEAKTKDCDKIVKAVDAAAAAAADARKAADAAKAAADLETDAATKRKATAAADKADASAKSAEKSAAAALDAAPGFKKAGEIGKRLDDIGKKVDADKDLSDEQKKAIQKALDELKKGVSDAGKAKPCDPNEMEDIFENLLNELYKKHSWYGPLKDFFEKYFNYDLNERRLYLQLIRYTPPPEQFVSATGRGITTGNVTTLTVHNPQPTAITAEIPACYIPSGNGKQPYITLPISVRLLPHETLQVALQGYCADVFSAPVPDGRPMPPVSEWVRLDEFPSDVTVPMLNPSALSESAFSPMDNPSQIGPVLLQALEQIALAYDELEASGSISTPFSDDPEKQRESTLQQVMWKYTAALSGKEYREEDFRKTIIGQYEAANGHPFKKASQEDKDRVEMGAAQFWGTFQLVGIAAKIQADTSK